MTFRIKGKLSQLTTFKRGLNGLGQGLVAAMPKVAERAETRLRKQHNRGKDPYGAKWKRRKKAYPWKILRKTLAMLGGVSVRAVKRSIEIQITVGYGIFHQFGTKNMAMRMIIPSKGRGLPGIWKADFAKVIKADLKKRLK